MAAAANSAALAPIPAAVVAPAYLVQAGTFADARNAEAMQARILQINSALAVSIASETSGAKPLSRVVISQLSSRAAAEAVRQQLQQRGIAALVKRSVEL